MRVFLFGDSYFESGNQPEEYATTWMYKLENLPEITQFKNFSNSGAGPQYTLPLINQMIQNKLIVENDIIIAHISATTRVGFPYKTNEKVYEFQWDSYTKKSFCYDNSPPEKSTYSKLEVQKFYNNFQSEIDFAYLTFSDLLDSLGSTMLGFLYYICKVLKLRVLVFGNVRDNFLLDKRLLEMSATNFYFSNYDLFDVSDREVFINEINSITGPLKADERLNHLSTENHEIMFDYITRFLFNKSSENYPKFKENFRHAKDVYTILNEKHPFKEKFIYD